MLHTETTLLNWQKFLGQTLSVHPHDRCPLRTPLADRHPREAKDGILLNNSRDRLQSYLPLLSRIKHVLSRFCFRPPYQTCKSGSSPRDVSIFIAESLTPGAFLGGQSRPRCAQAGEAMPCSSRRRKPGEGGKLQKGQFLLTEEHVAGDIWRPGAFGGGGGGEGAAHPPHGHAGEEEGGGSDLPSAHTRRLPPHLPRARRGGGGEGGGGEGGGAARAARGPSVSRAGGEALPLRFPPPPPPGRWRAGPCRLPSQRPRTGKACPRQGRPNPPRASPQRPRPRPRLLLHRRRPPPRARISRYAPPAPVPGPLLPVRGPPTPGGAGPRPLASPSARPAGPGPASGLLTGHSAPPIPALGPALGGSILAARTHRASLPRFGSRADWLRYRSPKPNQRLHSAAAQNGAQPRTKAREGAGAGGAGARRRAPRMAPPPSRRGPWRRAPPTCALSSRAYCACASGGARASSGRRGRQCASAGCGSTPFLSLR